MRHRVAGLVVELAQGGVVGTADLGVQVGTERLEHVVVVVMGSELGQQTEPGGGEDLSEALHARVSSAVFDGADGAP